MNEQTPDVDLEQIKSRLPGIDEMREYPLATKGFANKPLAVFRVWLRRGAGTAALPDGALVKVHRDAAGRPQWGEAFYTDICIRRAQLPHLQAKVMTAEDHETFAQATRRFWDRAIKAMKQRIDSAEIPPSDLDPAALVAPTEPGISANRWVEERWPVPARQIFFEWLQHHCTEEWRSPESAFAAIADGGRPLLPIAKIEELPITIDPLLRPEQVSAHLTASAFGQSMAQSTGNDAVIAMFREMQARLDALADENAKLRAKKTEK